MAEGKKGIIVYADWIDKFEMLDDAEAGRLIKHFFRFVNDLNPIAPDRITELSFIDIQKSLKRDLKKWENAAERSRNNGKLGGRPSKEKPTITQQVISEPRKPVNVNDNVNVNVTVNDIYLKKDDDENLEKILNPINSGKFSDFNIQDAPPQILQSSLEAWTYATDIELRKKITIDHVKDKWLQFVATNKDSPQWYNSENEIYTHFKRWITKQKFEDGNTKQFSQGGGKVGVSEARTTALQNW